MQKSGIAERTLTQGQGMSQDHIWRLLFAAAIAILMLGILLIRSEPVQTWVLIVYPGVGAMLAHIASRTSPTVEEIARIETSVIAAAAIFVLAAIVNVLLADLLMRQIETNEYLGGTLFDRVAFFALPALSVLLWLALERRLTRLRRERRDAAARRNPGR